MIPLQCHSEQNLFYQSCLRLHCMSSSSSSAPRILNNINRKHLQLSDTIKVYVCYAYTDNVSLFPALLSAYAVPEKVSFNIKHITASKVQLQYI